MKKIVVMLAVASVISGAVWAQDWAPDFSAVRTESVEKQFSAGLFDSDVDTYIDPSFFDGQIGNFVFAGGFHYDGSYKFKDGTAYNRYSEYGYDFDTFDWEDPEDADTISVGWGKTLSENKYLALYYGGSFVNAFGWKETDEDPKNDPKVLDSSRTYSVWRNKLAVLFGLNNNMGFRFDLIMDDSTSETYRVDGDVAYQNINPATTVALSWGLNTGKIAPWVKLGFKFPETTIITDVAQSEVTTPQSPEEGVKKEATKSEDSRFAVNAGLWLELTETSSLSFDLTVGGILPSSYKGHKDVIGNLSGYEDLDPAKDNPEYTYGGTFGGALYADYTKEITFGENMTVRIKPNVSIGFSSTSQAHSEKKENDDPITVCTFGAGIDIGGEYRFEKIGIYSGFGLRFFELESRADHWQFKGFAWDPDKFGTTDGNLRFGITFTPIEGLVLGTGFKFTAFSINPATMELTPGSTPGTTNTPAGFWTNTALSITLSYKFDSKPKEPKAETASATESAE